MQYTVFLFVEDALLHLWGWSAPLVRMLNSTCADGQLHMCGCLAPLVRMTNPEADSCIFQDNGTLFVVNKVY